MNGVRTRKKQAEVTDKSERKLNGHANPRDRDGTSIEQPENIFLFYPNIIGTLVLVLSFTRFPLIHRYRIFAHRPCHCLPLLYALAPKDLLLALQHIMPPRRSRWRCGAALRPVHPIRCRTGYGDRSLHNLVLARLPQLRLPTMGSSIPRSDQSRFRQSLHAHVCHLGDGRF